jgi:hypothetical protein
LFIKLFFELVVDQLKKQIAVTLPEVVELKGLAFCSALTRKELEGLKEI